VYHDEDMLLGKLAVREAICTQEQVDECLQMQSIGHSEAPLGDLLLFKRYLTDLQLKDLLGRQNKKIMSCPACRLSFTIVTLTDGTSARCPRCRRTLAPGGRGTPTRTDTEFPTAPSIGTALADVICVICDHTFQGDKDGAGRIRCPSCHSSFSPK